MTDAAPAKKRRRRWGGPGNPTNSTWYSTPDHLRKRRRFTVAVRPSTMELVTMVSARRSTTKSGLVEAAILAHLESVSATREAKPKMDREEAFARFSGESQENLEGTRQRLNVTLDPTTIALAEKLSARSGHPMSHLVEEAILLHCQAKRKT